MSTIVYTIYNIQETINTCNIYNTREKAQEQLGKKLGALRLQTESEINIMHGSIYIPYLDIDIQNIFLYIYIYTLYTYRLYYGSFHTHCML